MMIPDTAQKETAIPCLVCAETEPSYNKPGEACPKVKGLEKWTFLMGQGVVGWVCDDVHRQEANYFQVVQVDYLDCDYEEDYHCFGRWEKQLAS